ncbi:hypothetical protein KIN20_013439 [Parelaphostrongylus tenuis]|uniref:Uncharacterized protein n=1 Tax=Parelaphostrongylus tenuis TaxID=148309 RepID=A0AAD5MC52_PARTN|nr:hypothetical protein KIN20_013439 [Parelaphostrongylus tenuis]
MAPATEKFEANVDQQMASASRCFSTSQCPVSWFRQRQKVHDLREQTASQRFADLRQKMVQVTRAAPSCHHPRQSVRSSHIIRTVV